MGHVVQVAAALAVLLAFVLAQLGVLDQRAPRYLALNLAGAAVLAVDAFAGGEWGFLVLEATWALVSAWALVRIVGWPVARGG
jgi:hypothetical protein